MDGILERLIKKYEMVDSVQKVLFEDDDKTLISYCISNMRALLEQCSSRNIFNSYDRLNHFLKSSDIEIVEITLELLMVPGRKLDTHKSLRNSFRDNVSLPIIEALTSYYIPSSNAHLALEVYNLHKSRVNTYKENMSASLLNIRLMAIFLSIMMTPTGLSNEFYLFNLNPSIISEVVQNIANYQLYDSKIAANSLLVLRSFLKFDEKIADLSNSIRLSSPHGPWMTILRMISQCLTDGVDFPFSLSYFTAFIDLCIHMAASNELQTHLLSSGVLKELLKMIECCGSMHFKPAEKVVIILENMLNRSSITLDPFLNMSGLQVIVKKIQQLLLSNEHDNTVALTTEKSNVISALLRVIKRILISFATEDRMRNLIETALFDSLKFIFNNAKSFSAEVYGHAIGITAAFIHNEPSTLSILFERNIPQSLVDAVCQYIPADGDVLGEIMLSFEAICLTKEGEDYFATKNPLQKLMSSFTDPDFSRALMHGNASGIGQALEEFMRHHPNLQNLCVKEIMNSLHKLPAVLNTLFENQGHQKMLTCNHQDDVKTYSEITSILPSKSLSLSAQMLESVCLFLEPQLLNGQFSDIIVEKGVMEALVACLWCPGLGSDYPSSSSSFHALLYVFQKMSETNFDKIIKSLLSFKGYEQSLADLRALMQLETCDGLLNCPSKEARDLVIFLDELSRVVCISHDCLMAGLQSSSISKSSLMPADFAKKMNELLDTIICCHWLFGKIERLTPRCWFATAMQVPLHYSSFQASLDDKYSSYADPLDARIVNLGLIVSSLRNITLCGSLFLTSAFRLHGSVEEVSELCGIGILNKLKGLSTDSNSLYSHIQLLTFSLTIWNSMIIESTSLHGYISISGINAIVKHGGFNVFREELESVTLSASSESDEMVKRNISNLFVLFLMMLARISNAKSYRPSFWNHLTLAERSNMISTSEFIADFCKWISSRITEEAVCFDENGFRLYFSVIKCLCASLRDTNQGLGCTLDAPGDCLISSREFCNHLCELGKVSMRKYPKTSVDLGLSLCEIGVDIMCLLELDVSPRSRLELLGTVLYHCVEKTNTITLFSPERKMSLFAFVSAFLDDEDEQLKALSLLSLSLLMPILPEDFDYSKTLNVVFDRLGSMRTPPCVYMHLCYILSYIYHFDRLVEVEKLMSILRVNFEFMDSNQEEYASIPSLMVMIFRLSVERAEGIVNPLLEYELLERFMSWSFTSRDFISERFGPVLLRSPAESSALFSELFQFEGSGIIPRRTGTIRSQKEDTREKIYKQLPSEWSRNVLTRCMSVFSEQKGNDRVVTLLVMSETIGSYDFLRKSLVHSASFSNFVRHLIGDLDKGSEMLSRWSVHFMSIFLLPPTAHSRAYNSYEDVAPFTSIIASAFQSCINDLSKNESPPNNLLPVCECIKSILNITSSNPNMSKMVVYTFCSHLFEHKFSALLASLLKSSSTDERTTAAIVECLEILTRICSRFITRSKKPTSDGTEEWSVDELEEAFGSSDLITDEDMDDVIENEDVDMDILEEEGAIEDHEVLGSVENEDIIDIDDEQGGLIDTTDEEMTGDEEEYEGTGGSSDFSSEYEDGYEIVLEGDATDSSSSITEDEYVFEIDPSELVVPLTNSRGDTASVELARNDEGSLEGDQYMSGYDNVENEVESYLSDYLSDIDDEELNETSRVIDIHLDIPVSRRRSSAHTWSSIAQSILGNPSYPSGLSRNITRYNIPSNPLVTPRPFVISGSRFDDRMRPLLEPRTEKLNDPKGIDGGKNLWTSFEYPSFLSTFQRWEQLSQVIHGQYLQSRCSNIARDIIKVLEVVEEERKQVIATQSEEAKQSAPEIYDDDHNDDADGTHQDGGAAAGSDERTEYEDPGIDPSFLSAVPFDMLEEVLEQYFLERRANIPANSRVVISSSFLDSLSPAIRGLYIRLSNEEIIAHRQLGFQSAHSFSSMFSENDEDNDEFTESSSTSTVSSARSAAQPVFPVVRESSLILFDSHTVCILVKSFLSPNLLDQKVFVRLFVNLSSQARICSDLLGLLIYLLEESPSDAAQLEIAIEIFSSKHKKAPGTPKAPALSSQGLRRSNPPSRPSSAGPHILDAVAQDRLRTGPSPIFIVQRIIQLLNYLSTTSLNVREYFLAKSERTWTIKRQGRNTSFKSETKYPFALLIAAFESPLLIGQPLMTEQLLRLVHTLLKSGDPARSIEIPSPLFHSFVKSVALCDLSGRGVAYAIHIGQYLSQIALVQLGFVTELCDLVIKLSDQSKRNLDELKDGGAFEAVADPLSPQSKCLRILKILAAVVYSRPGIDEGDAVELTADSRNESLQEESVGLITDRIGRLCTLFSGLESYLPYDESSGTPVPVDSRELLIASSLLPFIECYFVCCRILAVVGGEAHLEQLSRFTECHSKVLNSLVRSTPSLLTVGSLRILTRTPKFLDFDNKRVFFRHQIHRRAITVEAQYGTLHLGIRRESIFEDSYRQLMSKSPEEVRYGKINVKFHGEDGVDAGGVTREWMTELSRAIFNPDYALFRTTAADRITYQPNRASSINPDHLQYFKFVGRVIGKALYDNRLLDCYFTRSFYKHMLGVPVDFKDLEAVDPNYYKSLSWLLQNNITDLVDQTFSLDTDEFGVSKTVELKPNGSSIVVTEENKKEYVYLLVEYRLHLSIKPQIDAFLAGLYEIIPLAALKIFNEQELELLISGLPDIDIDDWKANTELNGYLPSSPQIQWFWRCVMAMDVQERTQLIQFVTGTSKVPLEGFSRLQGQSGVQKFQIHRDYGSKDRLPSAHTCFNQLDLPEYESYEQLRDALLTAVKECSTGFGLA